jgi:hypothetical protein
MFGAILGALGPVLNTLVDRLIPDEAEKAKAKAEMEMKLLEMANAGNLGQMEVNKAEAASQSLLTSGWRPFIGWVCGCALAFQFVVAPIGVWGATVLGHPVAPPPVLDNGLWELMFGMLGLAGFRTFEKSRGILK